MSLLPEAHKLLSSIPLPMVVLSKGMIVASINPAGEQFFGQSQRRMSGKPLETFLKFDDAQMVVRLFDSDAPLTARKIEASVAGAGKRMLDVSAAPVADEPGWQVLIVQETHQGDVIAGDAPGLRASDILAHEIKNPLAGIRGAAQLLGRKLTGADQGLTNLIADEVDRIANLIDQMQSLSQRSARKLSPCNLHEAIRRATGILGAAQNGAAQILEEFDPSLPLVWGDDDALMQVLINLIANAREACADNPKPKVMVRTRFASGLQLYAAGKGGALRLPVEVQISDNGPGIDPEVREHIFEPFVTTKKSGHGLGLALVRKLVRDMNGHITHERDGADEWTHFRVHLAVADKRAAMSAMGQGEA